ncbi:VIT1/CCC1 family protein [Sulfurimonas sp. HSL3-7]|uniref:VIT1/CCC1 transporter family protein n=1 Tax=Sulfonitrofixus jiaomeiensis TaxID=3131938 RepID=UPI0031F849F6
MVSSTELKKALIQQQNEINDHALYLALAQREKEPQNREVFVKIAEEELEHYRFWEKITGQKRKASPLLIRFYLLLVTIFGTSFALKWVERREKWAEAFYCSLFDAYPEARKIYTQEQLHEQKLVGMLQDKKLLYAGAIVLGMNDALVELTGTLSGIALAFEHTQTVGITGAIMGVAASLSMAGSSYLEARENPDKTIRATVYAAYTGISYILTTAVLVLPFFLFSRIATALAVMFAGAVVAIMAYNFYIAVAKGQSFARRTSQMLLITLGVALISFAIGYGVHRYFGIEI